MEQDMSKFVNKKKYTQQLLGQEALETVLLQSPVFFYWLPVSMLSMVD